MSKMVALPGGAFRMGSDSSYPEEAPVVRVEVEPFEIDRGPVTCAEFAEFAAATGYVTVAERAPDPAQFPGVDPSLLVPGSLVFTRTSGPVDLSDWRQWWSWRPGASWRRPYGPDSLILGRDDHPVVQVAYEDALAYATWAGKRLPTEAEWEFAARGGLDGAIYEWGDEPQATGALRANTWQGRFPYLNTGANGWVGTSPVGSFPGNGYGLVDMTGNTWEWTSDYHTPNHDFLVRSASAPSCGCGPASRLTEASAEHGSGIPRRVLKGGSHLCAPEYCLRYRPAARSPQAEGSATTHIGFRCARSFGSAPG